MLSVFYCTNKFRRYTKLFMPSNNLIFQHVCQHDFEYVNCIPNKDFVNIKDYHFSFFFKGNWNYRRYCNVCEKQSDRIENDALSRMQDG